ncbi:MAG: response regulator [Oscillospiraceae bacterium]
MYKAILIDDEPWTLQALETLFPWADYDFELIASSSDSLIAKDLMIKQQPDVILTDINMPEISGLDLMSLAKSLNIKTKFVIISAYDSFKFAQEAIKYGAIEYVLKPLSLQDAHKTLENIKNALDKENGIDVTIKSPPYAISNNSFKDMIEYIKNNFTEKLTLNKLSELFNLNPSYCCQLFKKYYNCSFFDFVTDLKMRAAATMITKDGKSSTEIAEILNYDYSYFNKIFKKYYGITPLSYKKGYRK